MNIVSKFVIFLLLILSVSSCFTINPEYVQIQKQKEIKQETVSKEIIKDKGRINREKSLLSNRVNCVAADDKNVWVATDRGVSRFSRNENRWTYYTRLDGLASDDVAAVALDGKWVWFGTSDGVSRYDTSSKEWKTFKKKDGLASDKVYCIAVDGNYVWFGTDRGLNRYDKQLDSWALRSKKDGLSTNIVKAIAIETEYVWVGTQPEKQENWDDWGGPREKGKPGSGVNRYHRRTDSWNAYSKSDGLADDKLTAIAVGEDDVWFGTQGQGVSVYSKTDQTFVKSYTKTDVLSTNEIGSIAVDGNQIWIGTANAGAQRYLKTVNTWIKYTAADGLASNHVTWITVFGNEIWFGTYEGGLSKYNKISNEWTSYIKTDALADNDIKIVKADSKSNIWIGTALGLSVYDIKNKEWSNYQRKDGLITDYITDVELGNGAIWIGTDRGIGSFDEKSKTWRFYGNREGLSDLFVTALAYNGSIWAGTSHGLFRFNEKLKKWENATALLAPECQWCDQPITDLAFDKTRLWIGTENGIYVCAPTEDKNIMNYHFSMTHYGKSEGLSDDHVNAIIVADNGVVYVGTQNGLSAYKDGIWKTMPLNEKSEYYELSSSQNVRTLASDNGILWIGTLTDLIKCDLSNDQCSKVSINDGLSRYNVRSICVADDSLWVGTSAGLLQFKNGSLVDEYRASLVREPFVEPSISNIEFDGDYVWFSNWSSSPNGAIIRYDRETKTWRRFTRDDILRDIKEKAPNQVRRILVSSDYVWFATDYGVLRYNKLLDTWKHYTTEDGLASNDVGYIIESKKSIWAPLSESISISRYDKETEKWEAIDLPPVPDYPNSMDWLEFMEADGADVWFGFWSRVCGVRRYNEDTNQWYYYTRKEGLTKTNAQWISVDKDRIWVSHGWRGGLSYYDKKLGVWVALPSNQLLGEAMKVVVGEKSVWIITKSRGESGGVTRYDKVNDEWTIVRPKGGFMSDSSELVEDGDYVWLATFNDGINRFHMASGTWTNFNDRSGLLQNHTNDRALKVDERYVWVGTPRGLSIFDKQAETWISYSQSESLIGNEVRSVVADDRYVWCGTSQGLSRYDKQYGTWTSFRKKGGRQVMNSGNGWWSWWEPEDEDSLVNNNINSLAIDDRYLWVGTKEGAARYDKIANKWDRYSKETGLPSQDVVSMVVDGYDIWAGTSAGLCKYPRMSDDPNAWVTYTSGIEIKPMVVSKEYAKSLVSDEIWCLAVDGKNVWAGTRIGVSQYDKSRDTWTTYTMEDGLASDAISSICVEGTRIWFGSDNGVTMYDKNSKDWKIFTIKDGLSSDRITCIVSDADYVWFGTFDAGVSRYNIKTKQWDSFTRKDGIAHNSVLSISVDKSQIWFGTNRGLSRYDKVTEGWTTFTQFHGPEDI